MHRPFIEPAVWWLLLWALWLLTAAPVTAPELVVAAVGATPCAVAAGAARRAAASSWNPRAGWARWWVAVPVAVLADTVRVLTLPLRQRGPQLRRIGLPGEPDEAVAATRQAVVTLLLSLTPGSYVVDWVRTGPRDVVVTHALGDGRPRLDEAVVS